MRTLAFGLALAGITKATNDPVGGVVVKDASGEATGLLKASAAPLVRKIVPEPTTKNATRPFQAF